MGAASNYLENKLLDHSLKVAAYTQPTTLSVALFKNTSGNAAANLEANIITDEISTVGTAYARLTPTFGSASNGTSASTGALTWTAATANWGTVTHVAVLDQLNNVLYWGAVTVPKTIETGDVFQISAGNLTISLD